MKELVALMGLVLLIEGLPYFLTPRGMKRMMALIPRLPERALRLWGMAAMIMGLLLVYLGRQ